MSINASLIDLDVSFLVSQAVLFLRVTRNEGIIVFSREDEVTLKSVAAQINWRREHQSMAFLDTRGSDIRNAYQERRTALFFQIQGCDRLEDDSGPYFGCIAKT